MNNLDEKTREVIRYYQKLTGVEEEETSESAKPYAKFLADMHLKATGQLGGRGKDS
jgi:hypothetical protein